LEKGAYPLLASFWFLFIALPERDRPLFKQSQIFFGDARVGVAEPLKINCHFLEFVMKHWLWVLSFAGLLSLGCGNSGPTTYPVTGTVTFDGVPLAEADIMLLDADGKLAPDGGKVKDGQFQLKTTSGKKRVEIRATRKEKLPPGQEGAMGESEAYIDYIPPRYNSDSELTIDVQTTGENRFDAQLEAK